MRCGVLPDGLGVCHPVRMQGRLCTVRVIGCDRAIPNQNLLIQSFAYKIKCLLKNIVLLYSTGSHANALDAGL